MPLFVRSLCLFIPVLCLFACSASQRADEHARLENYQAKHQELFGVEPASGVLDLTIEQAFERAVSKNLDIRVAAFEELAQLDNLSLERLSALPQFDLIAGYQGRSSPAASSSESFLTGNESLEPSVSSDQYRRTVDLDMRFNLLDIALTAYRSRDQQNNVFIAQERLEKVHQNVLQDVFSAYWRAKAFQDHEAKILKFIDDAHQQIDRIEQAARADMLSMEHAAGEKTGLLSLIQNARGVLSQAGQADDELKSLLSLSPDFTVNLVSLPDRSYAEDIDAILDEEIKNLEDIALLNRPELKEAELSVLNTKNNLRREIISTFPGAEFFVGVSQDSNSFLVQNSWFDFTTTLSQSLANIFTLPARYRGAKNQREIERQRALALSVAVLTQTHITRERLLLLRDLYGLSERTRQEAERLAFSAKHKHKLGFLSGQGNMKTHLDYWIKNLQSDLARADMYEAYASMMNATGRSVFDYKKSGLDPGGGHI